MMDSRMQVRRCAFFEDFVDVCTRVWAEMGMPEAQCNLAANAMADHIAGYWGGQNMHIPKDYRRQLSHLELEIYDKFDGCNYDTLAQEYGLSDRTVRRHIANVKRRIEDHARIAQGDLFTNQK